MSAKPSYFADRSCRASLWAVLGAFVVLETTVGPVALWGEGQANQVVNLSVDDGRPVARAMEILEAKYGWIITYEDPRYVYQSDIQDVAYRVRKDFHQYPPGKAPPVLVPKGGHIDISYAVNPQTGKPDNPAALIQMILDDHAARGNPGVFRLKQTGEIFHVVPVQVKNREGFWKEQGSILDTLVTFPEEERGGFETLAAITGAVRQATKTYLVGGTMPMKLFLGYRSRLGASDETARDVLVRFLKGFQSRTFPVKLSWRLLYGPGDDAYALNIHSIDSESWREFILKQP